MSRKDVARAMSIIKSDHRPGRKVVGGAIQCQCGVQYFDREIHLHKVLEEAGLTP